MLLTDEEVEQLTQYKRPADQRRWLREHGFRFVIGARGRPRVARAEAERHLVGSDDRRRQTAEPAWDALP